MGKRIDGKGRMNLRKINKKYYCLFCGYEIFPEQGYIKLNTKELVYYIFQCENEECGSVYESMGRIIPDIRVYHRPSNEIDFWIKGEI